MKTSVCIEYDSETRTATVTVGGWHPQVWTDCNFSILKDTSEKVVDGWIVHELTGRRTVSIEGLAQ